MKINVKEGATFIAAVKPTALMEYLNPWLSREESHCA